MANLFGKFILLLTLSSPAIALAVSPLPPEPTIRGIRYSYWHVLRDLESSFDSWMNPNNPEQFTYRDTPKEAFDRTAEIHAAEALYEMVHADYTGLLARNEIDQIDPKNSHYGVRLTAAELVYGHTLSVHYQFAEVLRLFHLTREDRRYISDFFFFRHVSSEHRPLESLIALTRSSARAQALVDRVLSGIRLRLAAAQTQMTEIVKAVAADEKMDVWKVRNQLNDFKSSSNDLDYRLTWLRRKLLAASKAANDQLRKQRSVAELENQMRGLGRGLRTVLTDYRNFELTKKLTSHHYEHEDTGVMLTWPDKDLEDMFGFRGHVGGVTMFERERGSKNEKSFSILKDTALMQYLFAAGATMASLAESGEVRGTWRERATQELSYRRAQISSKFTQPATSTALTAKGDQKPALSVRRDFLSPGQNRRRSELEDHLWRLFFAEAKLHEFESPQDASCASLVALPEARTLVP